jgi:RNA recognition motif-containing protein
MRIWIGNITPNTTDDEIKTFIKKYAPNLECYELEHAEGSGTHPAVMMRFSGGTVAELGNLAVRLNGMYWKGRALNCNTMMR